MAENIVAEMTANVWKILVGVGDVVEEEQELLILESMKMEIPVASPVAGTVESIAAPEGSAVREGDTLIIVKSD
ncbi:biotin/lipoyl-binding carrier protein [Cumulibacter soli]|uniref:biotin/lipoyl-binding carrier protein n=1 Tax=Cumulibacter soli TaxID=2546344 RepID=UPI001067D146|nr:biotin/lipoyl-binding carrier protein [Cumulibacter soli]